jgi:hypothetical protein
MCGCKLTRLPAKDEEVDGSVSRGTSDSFSMVARRPKVDGDERRLLN